MNKKFIFIMTTISLLLSGCASNKDTSITTSATSKSPTSTTTSTTSIIPTSSTTDDKKIDIGEYTKYDLDTWMRPIWKGRVMHNETVSLIGLNDKAKLLYCPQEIVSVRDYTLKTEYKNNIDYKIDNDGFISLTKDTSFKYMDESEYYSGNTLTTEKDGQIVPLYYGEDFYKTQLAITYIHEGSYKGYIPPCYKDRFSSIIEKLQKGENVTFIFYGDSISYGCNCSEYQGLQPGTKPWAMMFTEFVAKKYQYSVNFIYPNRAKTYKPLIDSISYGNKGVITYINSSVGGWTSNDGFTKFDDYVKPFIKKYGCDLFVCGFSMNDGNKTPEEEKQSINKILNLVLNNEPNANFILLSTMIPNPIVKNETWAWNLNQPLFEDKFVELSDSLKDRNINCGVCKMTSLSKSILQTKRFKDITGNNVNHPSDFFVRIYAQAMFQTLIGY